MPRHRRASYCLFVFIAGLALVAVQIGASRQRPPPLPFPDTKLPEPPRQKQPWTPPTTELPKLLVTATAVLFEVGLADPRSCDYRVIEVAIGSCWNGGGGVVRTHGWVLPAEKDGKEHFAVCWNGLVYPLVWAGAKADLKADVRAAVTADEEWRAKHEKNHGKNDFYRFRHAWAEGKSVSHEDLLPVKTCLLLRLGEEKLAAKVWTAWTAGMKPDTNDDKVHLQDPYLMLAADWVWALFNRAVCAHMRGDDRLALADAQALTLIQKAVEAEAGNRGFERRRSERDQDGKVPYLNFLEPLPALRADQERRAKQPGQAKERRAELRKTSDKSRRIALLIEELEEASARQDG